MILCTIYAAGAIGVHRHETSDDINYVLFGEGEAVYDGEEETLVPGTGHLCKKNFEHNIIHTGNADLHLAATMVERWSGVFKQLPLLTHGLSFPLPVMAFRNT